MKPSTRAIIASVIITSIFMIMMVREVGKAMNCDGEVYTWSLPLTGGALMITFWLLGYCSRDNDL